jgi:hypothetical protein
MRIGKEHPFYKLHQMERRQARKDVAGKVLFWLGVFAAVLLAHYAGRMT